MEKFSTWTDKRLGINPFLPVKVKSENAVLKFVVGPLLALPRILLFSLSFLLLLIFDFISSLVFVSFLRRPLRRLLLSPLSRLSLFFLGFWSIRSLTVKTKQPPKSSTSISRGDVLFANHVSYVELLYLHFRFTPTFTRVPNEVNTSDGDKADLGVVSHVSLLTCFLDVVRQRRIQNGKDFVSLTALSKSAEGPVVVFPEAVTSNGRTVLSPSPALHDKAFEGVGKAHSIAFKLDNGTFSPTYTVGGFFVHLFRLCSQLSNKMEVRYSYNIDIHSDCSTSDGDPKTSCDLVMASLAKALRVPQSKFSATDRLDFDVYWARVMDKKKEN
eukprot:TRINITY_DN5559_c0_g1_i1.p1 TRINITY_DN5559_c0_g1~~TRINITY_DN5559_c0_g1_i1.p1  ORF type:complete len:360 (+),score=90.10 TRINITY_DN5559_c0_g1_i1:99-1082(+)